MNESMSEMVKMIFAFYVMSKLAWLLLFYVPANLDDLDSMT